MRNVVVAVLLVAVSAVGLGCAHSTASVHTPYQNVEVSGTGTNVETINALGRWNVFEVRIDTILDGVYQHPGVKVRLSAGELEVSGVQSAPAHTAPATQARLNSTTGKLTFVNSKNVDLPITLIGSSFTTKVVVRANSSTALDLPVGRYKMQIGKQSVRDLEVFANSNVDVKIS